MNDFQVNHRQSYCEQTIPISGDMLVLAARLAESMFSDTYVVYENNGEWFIGMGVAALITADADNVCLQMDGRSRHWQSELLVDAIQSALSSLPMNGWRAYGTADFELARHNYHLPHTFEQEVFIRLFIPTYEVHMKNASAHLRALDENKLRELVQLVASMDGSPAGVDNSYFDLKAKANRLEVPEIQFHDSDVYQQRVASAVHEIRNRQYLKVILSRTIPLPQEIDMAASYVVGRRANTPARSFLLNLDHMKAVGFSPETVVEVTSQGWVSTQPLAGTRALGSDETEEAGLREDLLHDSKEIHEHAVSVQLAFEELRSVCRDDSVGIVDFMSVSRRNTVQHLASRVKGRLQEGYNAWHAFHALFPAVTATGIPKRESIDAIGRFESQPRHLYSGCVMIADSKGFLDAALVLRTVFQKDGNAWLRVGAGIVDMSNPAREMEETCEKVISVSRHLVCL
jgi:salicylate synthase